MGSSTPRSPALERWAGLVGSKRSRTFALAVAVFLPLVVLTFANTPDDALITLRYAWNLLHHGQPVFNLGQRVEGYSSPLHLLIASAVLLLPGGDALLKLKLVSVVFGLATLWQTARLTDNIRLPAWARLSVMVAVAGSWNFAVSASNGLETTLVAFLATGAAAALASPESPRRQREAAVWAGLLALARPDALLIVAALGVASAVAGRDAVWWRRIRWLIGPAVMFTALLLFRVAYYGQLVPNTYFAKQLAPVAAVGSGISYLLSSQPLAGWGSGLILSLAEAGLIVFGLVRFLRARRVMLYPLAVVIAELLFVFESGGDWMKGGRFFVSAIPSATLLLICGVEAILVAGASAASIRRRRVMAVAVVAALAAPVSSSYLAPAWVVAGVSDSSLIASGHYPLSKLWATAVGTAACLPPGESVAYSEIGLFGFEHLDLRLVDTSGLTDTEVATHATAAERHPWGVSDPDWYRPGSLVGGVLMRARPAMILAFNNYVNAPPSRSILNGQYVRVESIPEPGSSGTDLFVYLRRGFTCGARRGALNASTGKTRS
jgi:arabinofuranosyltransferase